MRHVSDTSAYLNLGKTLLGVLLRSTAVQAEWSRYTLKESERPFHAGQPRLDPD